MMYLNVFAFLVCNHDLCDKMLRMRWDRFLADVLHEFTKPHRKPFFALSNKQFIRQIDSFLVGTRLLLPMKKLHSMLTPWLTMVTSKLWFVLNQSINSFSVGSFVNSNRSQRVHSVSPYLFFFAAMGSEKPKKGRARLIKPFL